MAPSFKIAIVQVEPKAVQLKKNFAKYAEYIRSAAVQGCAIVVLPEYHLTSWAPSHPEFLEASAKSSAYLPKYQDLARELNISIVPGTFCEPLPKTAGESAVDPAAKKLRNTAYFIAAGTGTILASYQKKNLWHPERPHLTTRGAGPHAAFDTPLKRCDGTPLRAGMLICWDLAFPEAARALVADGAELIIIPSWWYTSDIDDDAMKLNPDSEIAFLESATTARAFENTAALVFCNAGGLSGLSMPIVGTKSRIPVGIERMDVVEVDLDILRVAEENYKVRMDMNSKGWHYGYMLPK